MRPETIDHRPFGIRATAPRGVLDRHLAGRAEEQRILGDRLAAIGRAEDSLILVEGGAGTGKTALLRCCAEAAREQGYVVFSAAASAYESAFELNLIQQLCGERLNTPASVCRSPGGEKACDPLTMPQELLAACRALYWFVLDAAQRSPVLLVVDDLQWSDHSSLHCLAFLARRLGGHPVGIVVSQLTGDGGTDLVLLHEMRRAHPATVRIQLGPLAAPAVDDMIEEVLGPVPAHQRSAIAAWTGGNPFLLVEVLAALASAGDATDDVQMVPPGVLAWFLGRLPRGVPACLPVARAVAVLDDHASASLVAGAAQVSTAEATYAVQSLVDLGLLRSGDLLTFSQPVVQAAVLHSIPPDERAPLYQTAAEELRRGGAPSWVVISYLVDSQAVSHTGTVALLMDAVRDAVDNMPVSDRPALLRRVLSAALPDAARREVLHLLGRAELDLDARPAAIHLDEARRLAVDIRQQAAIAADQAHALHALGRDRQAVTLLQEAAELLLAEGAGDPDQLVQLGAQAAEVAASTRITYEPVPFPAPDPALGDVWRILDPVRCPAVMLAWLTAVRATLAGGDHQGPLASCCDWVSAHGQGPVRQILARSLHAEILLLLGRVTQAATETAFAVKLISSLEQARRQLPVVAALPPLIDTLIEHGDADGAAQLLAMSDLTGDPPPVWHHTVLLASRGRLRHTLGDPVSALADLLECGRRLAAWADRAPHHVPWRMHAVPVLLDLGETAAAQRLAAEELDQVRRRGSQPRELGVALRMAGQVAGGKEGIDLLAEAVATLEHSTAVLDLARALGLLGQGLCRAGKSRSGRDQLKRACALAGEAGAVMLYNELTNRLREAGGRIRGRGYGVAALTASERQVARMAVHGRTNKEIAGSLFITRRTVEMHLTQAYRKLGVTGRDGLAAVLADEGE